MIADLAALQPRGARRCCAARRGPVAAATGSTSGATRAPFVERLIVPQASAVWSADPRQMWTLPGALPGRVLRTTTGCSASRDRPQLADGRRRLAPLRRGARRAAGATACGLARRSRRSARHDDHVDGHAARRRAGALRRGRARRRTPTRRCGCSPTPTDREHEILGAIPYQPNEAVLHTDRALLPRRRRAWASWNYHLLDDADRRCRRVTYHMNRLQALRRRPRVLRDAEPHGGDRPGRRSCARSRYAHPVFTAEGVARAGAPRTRSAARDRTHYCGAYWGWGFHEDGVVSARARGATRCDGAPA